jgi:macrolide-specific efflux system membrane fusion protein
MRWKVPLIVVLLAVAVVAVAASLGVFTPSATDATSLLTTQATVTDVADEVAASGTVQTTETWALAFGVAPVAADGSVAPPIAASEVSWPVTQVGVAVGDGVSAGDVLAVADTADLEARIAEATRSAKVAALQLKQAEIDLDDAASGAPRRQARIALYNAETAKSRADDELGALIARRERASLVAPVGGIVTAVAIQAGVDAPAGAAITVAARALAVSTSVVESDVSKISIGQAATVTVDALSATLDGTVSTIAPTAEAGTGSGVVSYAVTVALDAPPDGLRPGMSADVTIVTATASLVVAIPSRALSGTSGSYTVRVVTADGSVETRQVEVGLVTNSLAEVTSGLSAGETVVTGTSSSQANGQDGVRVGGGVLPGGGGGFIPR